MTTPKPQDPARRAPPTPEREPPERGGDVRHIIDKGLPPGINIEDAIDPGSQTPRTPVDTDVDRRAARRVRKCWSATSEP